MILALIVIVSGWYARIILAIKPGRKSSEKVKLQYLLCPFNVSTTINVIENAVKALADSPWIAPALLSKGEPDIENANSVLDRYSTNSLRHLNT